MKHNSPAWPGVVNMWSKKYIEETGQDNVSIDVGTGPFEMIEFRAEDRVEMKAVKDHWRQTPEWEGLEVLEVREAATRVAMMKAGEVGYRRYSSAEPASGGGRWNYPAHAVRHDLRDPPGRPVLHPESP